MQSKEQINLKIADLFAETMQDMAFIDVTLGTGKCQINPDAVAVKLEVIMPYSGDLFIAFDRDVAKEFAMNVFGEAQFVELQDPVMDASSEFLNVIIGKIFSAFAPNLLFELGLPQVMNRPDKLDASSYDVTQHYITPEGKNIIFYFRLERLISAFQHHMSKKAALERPLFYFTMLTGHWHLYFFSHLRRIFSALFPRALLQHLSPRSTHIFSEGATVGVELGVTDEVC